MNNEKGLSLIEVLASIVIFSLVIGVGIMLFSSVQSLWNHTNEKQDSQHNINLTLHTIKKELAGAVEIYYHIGSTHKELRIKPFKENSDYTSIFYDGGTHTISLYQISSSSDFAESTTPYASPGEYSKVIDLADDLMDDFFAFQVIDESGSELSDNTYWQNGELVKVELTFTITRKATQGGQIQTPSEPYLITQKLLLN
jgi:prepilin-type N-terminal cleavage/methylation domain-containing protein